MAQWAQWAQQKQGTMQAQQQPTFITLVNNGGTLTTLIDGAVVVFGIGGNVLNVQLNHLNTIHELNGTIILDEHEQPLWHPYFETDRFAKHLGMQRNGVFLSREEDGLVMRGGTHSAQAELRGFWVWGVQMLKRDFKVFHLIAPQKIHKFHSSPENKSQLISRFGNNVGWYQLDGKVTFILKGGLWELSHLRTILLLEKGKPKRVKPQVNFIWGRCVVCGMDVDEKEGDEVFKRQCRHVYCKKCFLHRLSSIESYASLPLTCRRSAAIPCPDFTLSEIKKVAGTAVLTSFLKKVFSLYVRAIPDSFPAPNHSTFSHPSQTEDGEGEDGDN